MENIKDVIIQCNEKFLEAFNNGNAKGVAMNYTNEAKLFPPNSDVIKGIENIEAFWLGAMNMGIKTAILETVNAEEIGNTVIEEGRYKLYIESGQMADHGKYIVIWRKTNDTWKLDLDIWNSSNPPA